MRATRMAWASAGAACVLSAAGGAQDSDPLPRYLTEAERKYLEDHPLVASTRGAPPVGPLWCPPEYHPCQAILIAWEGSSTWKNILAQLAAQITTVGDADLYVGIDNAAGVTSATNTLQSAGTNMARVQFFTKTLDTIWIRDYGPRFVYEGNVRVIVDHTYNRPRPNDDAFPDYFAGVMGFAGYDIPLVHGGGNFHLSGLGDSHATRLIVNENPGLSETQIVGYWQSFQGLDTTLYTPFRTFVDSTQHIDMWMIMVDDRTAIISDWPLAQGSYEDNICEGAATSLAAAGYTVYRTPAVSVGGIHYTFANSVLCNDLAIVPSYTNNTAKQYNAQALATWQQACPDKTVVQMNAEGIVSAAGVFHCIVMHVPEPALGSTPSIYLRTPNGGESFDPGDTVEVAWSSDDDVDTYYVKLLLSTDGGQTYPTVIHPFWLDTGEFVWTVPDVYTTEARIKGVIYDWNEGQSFDISDANFTINGEPPCVGDFNGDGTVNTLDVTVFLNAWVARDPDADINEDGTVNTLDVSAFLNAWAAGC